MPIAETTGGVERARFVSGSLLRHVCVMAGTGAIGLIAVFAVDLINLFYISLLGEKATAAAVGFAGVVGFFHASLCIGLTIGIAAVVSRTVGAGRTEDARRIGTSSLVLMAAVSVVVGTGTAFFLHPALQALGAEGETARLAQRYLSVTVHTLPLLGIGMATSALLRSIGDARRAMTVTLAAAFVTAVLDPILIFGFGLGLDGAAISAVVSRMVLAAIGLHGVMVKHRMLGRFDAQQLAGDARALGTVAGPAVLTNLATPVGAAFVTHAVAQFGPSAVAGAATIDRLTPVAFGLVYALSGAVGPILAQNLRRGAVPPRAGGAARQPAVHGGVGGRGVAGAGTGPRRADSRVLGRRAGGGADLAVLQLAGRELLLRGRAVRGERVVQQPRASAVVDGVQLGARHAGHDSVCLVGLALRRGRRADRAGRGLVDLRVAGGGGGVPAGREAGAAGGARCGAGPVLDAPVAPTSPLVTPQSAGAATGPAASAAAP